jgi:hypothetical protein
MAFFHTIVAVRILFTAALVALASIIVIRLSCRCMSSQGALGRLRKAAWFQWLFKRHCLLWWVFGIALAVHIVFALGFLGIPY